MQTASCATGNSGGAEELRVIKLNPEELKRLRHLLSGVFPHRDIPYGVQFRLPDGVVNVYDSGKVVVSPGVWNRIEPFLAEVMDRLEADVIGCDEAGKGELLGPVVTACVRVSPESYRQLRYTGAMDSKEIRDLEKVWDKVRQILNTDDYAVFLLSPIDYRRLHSHWGSINRILEYMFLHTASRLPPAEHIIIDAFAKTTVLTEFWHSLLFVPRAERFVSVALASVLAKVEYLRWIRENVPEDVVQIARRSDVSVEERLRMLEDMGYIREKIGIWLKPWKKMV